MNSADLYSTDSYTTFKRFVSSQASGVQQSKAVHEEEIEGGVLTTISGFKEMNDQKIKNLVSMDFDIGNPKDEVVFKKDSDPSMNLDAHIPLSITKVHKVKARIKSVRKFTPKPFFDL